MGCIISNNKDIHIYSMDEVSRHNKHGDVWIIIDNYVYDVTDFLSIHPGGGLPFINNAGDDVSHIFKMFRSHRSKSVQSKLKTMKIGKISK